MRSRQQPVSPPRVEPAEGVYEPASDTRLLLDAFTRLGPQAPAKVLDLCCGSGVIAIAAAQLGHHVDAVDADPRAVHAARRNAVNNGVRITVHQGDIYAPLNGRRFDAIVANPPYVPTPPGGGVRRFAWSDGGADGRALIGPICRGAARHLNPGGSLWLVQSSLASTETTLAELNSRGLAVEEVARRYEPFGPITREREDYLKLHGYAAEDDSFELLSVIQATTPKNTAGFAARSNGVLWG